VFPENEVRKGQLTMELKKLKETQERLAWPSHSDDLPIISWESCMSAFVLSFPADLNYIYADLEQSRDRPLILISGFIHDVTSFLSEHPGGPHLLTKSVGKDATTAFFGGVYDHSNAAHNVSLQH
jgi:stearoyl-CoA desaturase (delta-9 desaturase)